MILIYTSEFDPHADFIIEKLSKRISLSNIFRFNTDDWPLYYSLSFEKDGFFIKDRRTGSSISKEDISAFWYRRPKPSRLAFTNVELPPDTASREFIFSSCDQLLNGILLCLPKSAVKINDPCLIKKYSNKLVQMHILSLNGVRIPNFISSNETHQVRRYLDSNRGSYCIKPLDTSIFLKNRLATPLWTRRFSEEELDDFDHVVPGIVQEIIDEPYEARVVGIGDNIFIFRTDYDRVAIKEIDIRKIDESEKSYTLFYSEDILHTAKTVMATLELNFISMDVLVSKNSVYVIDVNPIGQWLWLEIATHTDMSTVFCDLLTATL